MSDATSHQTLRELAAARSGPCVSVYLTNPGGRETHEAKVRLERLLAQAERKLGAAGMGAEQASELLAPARRLLSEPWRQGAAATLALFAAPGFYRPLHPSFAVADTVSVGDRFHLRPLLPLLAEPGRFYVLALSLNQVRLVEVTPAGSRRLPLGELERGFTAAMGYDEFYSGLQVHSAGARGGGATRRPAVVHGHGDTDEEKLEQDLRHWFRRIAEGLAARALDPSAPRVLATTVEHASAFQAASRDPLLLRDTVHGNPDRLSDAELGRRARPLVAAALLARREETLALWRELLGGPRASGDLGTILRLAPQRRVRTLLVPAAAELWGRFDAATGRLEIHPERQPDDEELIERAAIATLAGGGEVAEVADPAALGGAPAAAVLRA
jgi:hypothetical protein